MKSVVLCLVWCLEPGQSGERHLKQPLGAARFFTSTDALIEKHAVENPQAAADYEDAMNELMKEYETLDRKKQDDPRFRVEYAENDLFDLISPQALAEFERDLMIQHQPQFADQQQPQYQHQQHQPQYQQETPVEMERRIRRQIEIELMEQREQYAHERQWPSQDASSSKDSSSAVCLPYPIDSVCGANIFFSLLWLVTATFSGLTYYRTCASSSFTKVNQNFSSIEGSKSIFKHKKGRKKASKTD